MRHNNKFLLKLTLVAITFASCNKYLDVNSDPNRVTDANITPELIFTQAEVAVGGRQASSNFIFLNHWVGYSGQNGTFAPQQNEISYNIDFSFGNAVFVNHMDVLFDLYQAKTKALVTGDKALAGASIVLSAKLFQELVDMYGNIPYSQAFQVATYPTPAYDKAQDIYKDLQLKLDSAITYLEETPSNAFKAADVIAHGNTDLWIKFANTMKLRLLIRQSETGIDPSTEIAKIQAKGGVLMAGESVSVNPGFVNDVNKQNTFYSNYGWTPTGVVATSSDAPNNYIVTKLQNDADPRLARFFYPVGFNTTTWAGAVYGDDVGNIPTAVNLSYFGPALVGNINSSNQGDGSGASQDQWIMPSFESMFLYAEAVARGWIPGAVPDSIAYQNAVTESFRWVGVEFPDSLAKKYWSSNDDANFDLVKNSSITDKAKFIAYQKYLAMTMIDPIESWADIRRLNMLTDNSYISAFSGRLSNTLPLRLLYPQSEYTTNATNVLAEGTIDQFSSKLFWEP